MGNFKIKSIWENKNTGGNVPADLEQRLTQVENKTNSNTTSITNLNNEAVKISGNQDITGRKTFTSAGEAIQIKETGTNAGYITGYSDSTKKWAIGNNGSGNDLLLESTSGNVYLKAQNIIHCNNKRLANVAEPTANNDGATKQYVDNNIQHRETEVNISNGGQNQVNPTNGYKVINVLVARKRQSDGYWFFDFPTTLNYQFFMHSNGKYTIYNNGNASGFTNDFKLFITEMKV